MNQIMQFTTAYKQLQPSEKVFVDGFVSDLEVMAVRAGQKLDVMLGLSVNDNLDERSRNFLNLSLVRAAITERVRDLAEEKELSTHKTLKELRSLAYSNINNYMYVGADGQPYFDLGSCTPEEMAAIKSIEIEEKPMGGRKFKFQLHDKVSSLDKLMKYQGLLDGEQWKNENAKTVKAMQLTVDTSDEDAADLYSKMING